MLRGLGRREKLVVSARRDASIPALERSNEAIELTMKDHS
jgi:hypothetical protein